MDLGGPVTGLPGKHAGCRPGGGGPFRDRLAGPEGFHHRTEETVEENKDWVAPTVGQVKGGARQVVALLDRPGGKDRCPVIPWLPALDRLEIIALGRGDIAEAGAAAHDIHDYTRELGGVVR